jgi:hypothetical protein
MNEDRLIAGLVDAALKVGETESTVAGWLLGLVPDMPPWIADAVAEELRRLAGPPCDGYCCRKRDVPSRPGGAVVIDFLARLEAKRGTPRPAPEGE